MPVRISQDTHGWITLHLGYTDIRLSDAEARLLLTRLGRELSQPKPRSVTPAKWRRN